MHGETWFVKDFPRPEKKNLKRLLKEMKELAKEAGKGKVVAVKMTVYFALFIKIETPKQKFVVCIMWTFSFTYPASRAPQDPQGKVRQGTGSRTGYPPDHGYEDVGIWHELSVKKMGLVDGIAPELQPVLNKFLHGKGKAGSNGYPPK
jgi:hypothetical protein